MPPNILSDCIANIHYLKTFDRYLIYGHQMFMWTNLQEWIFICKFILYASFSVLLMTKDFSDILEC